MSVSLMDSIWDYFVKVSAVILISAAMIMIFATILTLAFRITRAAMKNPVESLRYE
jgi:fucose permease